MDIVQDFNRISQLLQSATDESDVSFYRLALERVRSELESNSN